MKGYYSTGQIPQWAVVPMEEEEEEEVEEEEGGADKMPISYELLD
jgi:hypothetical protein